MKLAMKKLYYLLFIIIATLVSCDGGLEPPAQVSKSYLKGTIYFKSSWPQIDSLKDLRVVAFKSYPPKDILTEVVSGNAIFTQETLPFNVDSSNFSIEFSQTPLEFKYIAVAWQFGGLLDWKAIGVYSLDNNPNNPSPIKIETGKTYNISINADFINLPPQPF